MPALAEPGEVDHAAERVQRLRGADVVGRLLAADVLLAGLQREDEAAAAVDVDGLAGDPAGHPADLLLGGAEEAERGAAEVEPVAERLALADRDVDAALARAAAGCRGSIGSTAATSSAPARLAAAASASRSSTAPRKFGFWTKTAAVSASTAAASAPTSVTPPSSADLDDLGGEAARVGAERLAAVRMEAPRDDEPAAPGRADRQVAGGGDRRRPLVQRGVRDRQAVSSEIAVWNSNIACRPPWEISGW